MDISIIDQRLASLERRGFWLRLVCGIQFALIAGIWLSGMQNRQVQAQSSPFILRVRGLIIEDSQGRPRILLGAPFPAVRERLRQDARTTSMLFLDQNGHDRLTLGQELEPQVGGKLLPPGVHRIASGFGVVIHDGSGDERGAYGWLTNGRALLTLDRPGAEAFAAVVNDKTGETKIAFGFPPEIARDASAIEIGTKESLSFLRFMNKVGKDRTVFSTESGGFPSFKIFDDLGKLKQERLATAQ